MSKFVNKEAFRLLCGRKIGSGVYRTVYECSIDPTLVVKVEDRQAGSFANVAEYEFWNRNEGGPAGVWLAPCVDLSPNGVILLQKRVEPLRKADLPKKIPTFLTDTHIGNFGMFEGRIVCCDYARVAFDPDMRLKKAYW